MTAETLQVAQTYFAEYAPANGSIWRRSRNGGTLGDILSETSATRALTKRVNQLGRNIGIDGLSAHDCRHYWATQATRNGTPLDRLQDAGGWSSLAMPMRYIEAAKIANEGVKLA